MYKPAPTRPKKTGISRSRTGCKSCRQRRTKCDEQKPCCGTCKRLETACERFSPKLEFRSIVCPPADFSRGDDHGGHSRGADRPGPKRPAGKVLQRQGSPVKRAKECSSPPWSDLSSSPERLLVGSAKAPELSNHIPPVVFAIRDPRQFIVFYKDIWRKLCVPALQSDFDHLEALGGPSELVTDIMVALAACRLSRASPQKKIFAAGGVPSLSFRPDCGHESLSHERYGALMRRIASWDGKTFDANPTLGLAALVLFCYLESSMGNFQASRIHSEGTRRLIQSHQKHLVYRKGNLLAAWVEIEMQNWWRRVYFSTPDFHRSHASLALEPQLEACLGAVDHPRAAVLLNVSESHRLSNAAIVSCWDAATERSLRVNAAPLGLPKTGGFGYSPSLEELTESLKVQSQKLDDWFALLPLSHLPACWRDKGKHLAQSPADSTIQALHFSTHTSAMNFAYYVTARVLQCTSVLGTLSSTTAAGSDHMDEDAEAWIQVLMRIAAGIDWDECVRLNPYTVGFASLLLACALRTRERASGLWMQRWLEERLKGDKFEEGNFPVFQILQAVRLINTERSSGRDVYALFQTVDDEGGSGKLGSYHSQRLVSLWVYGRCRETGAMYSYRGDL